MARPKDDTWVVKDDEYHPDPTVAAKHADLSAMLASQDYHRRELKRLLTSDVPLTHEQSWAVDAHRAALKDLAGRITEHGQEDE